MVWEEDGISLGPTSKPIWYGGDICLGSAIINISIDMVSIGNKISNLLTIRKRSFFYVFVHRYQ